MLGITDESKTIAIFKLKEPVGNSFPSTLLKFSKEYTFRKVSSDKLKMTYDQEFVIFPSKTTVRKENIDRIITIFTALSPLEEQYVRQEIAYYDGIKDHPVVLKYHNYLGVIAPVLQEIPGSEDDSK